MVCHLEAEKCYIEIAMTMPGISCAVCLPELRPAFWRNIIDRAGTNWSTIMAAEKQVIGVTGSATGIDIAIETSERRIVCRVRFGLDARGLEQLERICALSEPEGWDVGPRDPK